MNHHTATPSFDSRFSHTPCGLGFGCSKESRINLANSISMRCVRTAEHLAGMLTTGTCTTIQWKSLVRLSDTHALFRSDVRRVILDSSCSAVSWPPSRAMSNAHSSQRDFEAVPWDESQKKELRGSELRVERPTAFSGTRRIKLRQLLVRNMQRCKYRGDEVKVQNDGLPLKPHIAEHCSIKTAMQY